MISKPLLSIAIPTYNRAAVLDIALSRLMPQLVSYREKIELIISDNGSTDDTQRVIANYSKKKLGLKLITHLQTENTGYFGNFRTCRELSTGEYIWILSDNEHVNDGAIELLVKVIENRLECGAFFLDNCADQPCRNNQFSAKIQFAADFFNSEMAYSSTLVSNVIFRNDKVSDEEIYSRFKGNLFLGFLLFCGSVSKHELICSVKSSLIYPYPAKVSFDVFKAWAVDIVHCLDYMQELGLLDEKSREVFMSGFIKTNLRSHTYVFRSKKSPGIVTQTLPELRVLLDNTYSLNDTYLKTVSPLLHASTIGFYRFIIWRNLRRLVNKLIRMLCNSK